MTGTAGFREPGPRGVPGGDHALRETARQEAARQELPREDPARHEARKEAHIRACLEFDVRGRISPGFDRFAFLNEPLPELDWVAMDLSVTFLGRRLAAPLLIAPMTGGCRWGGEINRNLAAAAQELGLAFGVGSQRAGLANPDLEDTYRVREVAPDVLLLANLGAVQLNTGYGLEACRRAVDMIGADALYLHLNPLQELFQPQGDRNWSGLLEGVGEVAAGLDCPLCVKEVGWGIPGSTAAALEERGVAAIDVAGAGGTSWYLVQELLAGRNPAEVYRSPLAAWGIPTVESLVQVLEATREVPVVASGGVRTAFDAAVALALGASVVSIGLPLLAPAVESAEAVAAWLASFLEELRAIMFCLGAPDVASLRGTPRLVPAGGAPTPPSGG